MDEQLEFLKLVVARLEAARIPYMLTGLLALAINALPRMTRDIDFVIDADERRVAGLVAALATDSYVSAEAASAAVRAQLATLYASRSAAVRFRMATSLFGTAKRLAMAGIRLSAAGLDERAVRAALFVRLHEDQVPQSERAAVLRLRGDETPLGIQGRNG
jgi:hypothetical protein